MDIRSKKRRLEQFTGVKNVSDSALVYIIRLLKEVDDLEDVGTSRQSIQMCSYEDFDRLHTKIELPLSDGKDFIWCVLRPQDTLQC